MIREKRLDELLEISSLEMRRCAEYPLGFSCRCPELDWLLLLYAVRGCHNWFLAANVMWGLLLSVTGPLLTWHMRTEFLGIFLIICHVSKKGHLTYNNTHHVTPLHSISEEQPIQLGPLPAAADWVIHAKSHFERLYFQYLIESIRYSLAPGLALQTLCPWHPRPPLHMGYCLPLSVAKVRLSTESFHTLSLWTLKCPKLVLKAPFCS